MSYEIERPPNHELNLSRIQSLDFTFKETRDWVFEKFSLKINPVIVFEGYKENEVHRYDLRIQSDSWEGFGGKYSTKKPYTEAAVSENSDPNFDCVFTLSDFKKALEENKNRIILYFLTERHFCVPLTPQEVDKLIERVEITEKNIREEEAKQIAKQKADQEAALQKRQEEKKQYNEKMDNLRQQRCQGHAV
jgi:hypothetical protein